MNPAPREAPGTSAATSGASTATPGASASVLARLHPLPSPRGVALEILRLSLREDVSVSDLARLAQVDPALCGRLLKAANAAARAARPVATAQEAILRVGLRASARLALAFSLVGDHHGGPCRAFGYAAFWTGSLVRGLAAQALAARCEVPGADEAFCAGLLAHVGRLALATAMPGPYARLLEECPDADPADLRRRERAAFGIDHVGLADALLEDWGFPASLRQAIAAHADPESLRDGGPRVARLARVLHVADRIAAAAVAQGAARQAPSADAARAAQELDVAADALQALVADLERSAAEWAALLGIDPPVDALLDLEPPAAGDAGLPALPGAGERVLVVDGDAARAAVLAGALAKNGYRATIARSGDEALTAFVVRRPQALVVDRSTPGVELGAFCRALRDTQSGETLYVVAVGEVASAEAHEAALEEGADDLLTRPVAERALLARLGAGLRTRRRCAFLERELGEVRALAAALAADNRLLEDSSRIDRATGLPDRRLALERLAQACAASARRRTPIACLLVEPDGVVPGAEGAARMPALAARLKATVRAADTLCRFGDTEFLVVAPDTDRGEAAALAARLRASAASGGAPTASVGIASVAFGDCTPAELVRRAEQALLASRLAGGDRASEYGGRFRRVV